MIRFFQFKCLIITINSVRLVKRQQLLLPYASENVSALRDPQELVLRGRLVEGGHLLVDEEGVGDPDEADVLRPHHQLLDPEVGPVEPEPVARVNILQMN